MILKVIKYNMYYDQGLICVEVFTAQSTQRSHVSLFNHTFTGQA